MTAIPEWYERMSDEQKQEFRRGWLSKSPRRLEVAGAPSWVVAWMGNKYTADNDEVAELQLVIDEIFRLLDELIAQKEAQR